MVLGVSLVYTGKTGYPKGKPTIKPYMNFGTPKPSGRVPGVPERGGSGPRFWGPGNRGSKRGFQTGVPNRGSGRGSGKGFRKEGSGRVVSIGKTMVLGFPWSIQAKWGTLKANPR